MQLVLVINAGSSSIKLALFDAALGEQLAGSVSDIGGAARMVLGGLSGVVAAPDHAAALTCLLEGLAGKGIAPGTLIAAGHRVVHGGPTLTAPERITPEVMAQIGACIPLAPLHNPHNLAAIRAMAELAPGLRQVASFDTAFHATNPPEAVRFALPDTPATRDLRRYGFHGLSYASLCDALPRLTGQPLPHRLLAFHLGNGASACAIVNGRSVCTTMGHSPLDGLTMGTRPGSLDASVVLTLVDRIGLNSTRALLNQDSGLRGLSDGISDMRALLNDPSETARFALDHFCYWAIRHGGSLIAAMGGLDAVAFTGGIGENAAPVRDRIVAGLSWLSAPVFVVPAAEERQIARDTMTLLGGQA